MTRKEPMNRRNFSLALTALLVAAVGLLQKGMWQVGSRFFQSFVAWHQTRAQLNERQKRMAAAEKDLRVIVRAELNHIKKERKFATLDGLVSSGDLGSEMVGRHGHVYSIRLEGDAISTSAYPTTPGEQLPAVHNCNFGPGLAPVLARLQKLN
jgi:hypothetical protein